MLSALLVDDEPLANERMRKLLDAHGGIEVVGTAGSVKAAQAMLEQRSPDVVFLDVEMPGGRGFDLLLSVPAGMQVVFVTAHEKYAVEAFATSAVDYLVKPVNPERLAETMRRLEEIAAILRLKATAVGGDAALTDDEEADDATASGAAADHDRLKKAGLGDTISVPLQGKGRSAVVSIADICWIESLRNYTRVGLMNPGRILFFRRRLGEWEADLPAGLFERLGKSLIVQIAMIQETEWKSRDETVLTFAADIEPLVLGRMAAMRLRDVLGEGSDGLA
jgi:two-component system LytT family response regulator